MNTPNDQVASGSKLITRVETAALLGIAPCTLHANPEIMKLSIRLGGRRMFVREQVEALVPAEPMVLLAQAAKMLGLSRGAMSKRARKNQLPTSIIRGRLMVPLSYVERLVIPEAVIGTDEAAQELAVSREQVTRLIKQGALPHRNLGRRLFVPQWVTPAEVVAIWSIITPDPALFLLQLRYRHRLQVKRRDDQVFYDWVMVGDALLEYGPNLEAQIEDVYDAKMAMTPGEITLHIGLISRNPASYLRYLRDKKGLQVLGRRGRVCLYSPADVIRLVPTNKIMPR